MTTTVGFATRDCLAIGCDSLATSSQRMIDPEKVWKNYFDEDGQLITNENGEPKLNDFGDIYNLSENIPYNQAPNVTKIFDLKPANAGLLFAGIAGIGNKSIKNLVEGFKSNNEIKEYLQGQYTIFGIAKRLYEYLEEPYNETYQNRGNKPAMDITVSGYSYKYSRPEIYKVYFNNQDSGYEKKIDRGEFGVIFGGQVDVIQRVVHGIDSQNIYAYANRVNEIINDYNKLLEKDYIPDNVDIEFPNINDIIDELGLYDSNWTESMSADLGNFSEQAAIDFVDFLINIMIKFQQFSSRLPTVGGGIHIALLTKSKEFRWISKEEYNYGNHSIPKHKQQ